MTPRKNRPKTTPPLRVHHPPTWSLTAAFIQTWIVVPSSTRGLGVQQKKRKKMEEYKNCEDLWRSFWRNGFEIADSKWSFKALAINMPWESMYLDTKNALRNCRFRSLPFVVEDLTTNSSLLFNHQGWRTSRIYLGWSPPRNQLKSESAWSSCWIFQKMARIAILVMRPGEWMLKYAHGPQNVWWKRFP